MDEGGAVVAGQEIIIIEEVILLSLSASQHPAAAFTTCMAPDTGQAERSDWQTHSRTGTIIMFGRR